jgi:diphosphomevalonate decarboxylase
MNTTWLAAMPANIALIKYMGKADFQNNRPTNTSLSYTLNYLNTYVQLDKADKDQWQSLDHIEAGGEKFEFPLLELNEKSQTRFLNHLKFIKKEFKIEEHYFLVKSNNQFPQGCGLASSASSFAALTMAVYKAAKDINSIDLNIYDLANLSQKGSGSSCRSFFEEWSIWDDTGARELEIKTKNLMHQVIVVEDEVKEVSSSEAHKNVLTSELFTGRAERANNRCAKLVESLNSNNWEQAYEICWAEFWDMHALFETSKPHFSYMTEGSLKVLREVEMLWKKSKKGPLVTMDAGANLHLLYRPEDKAMYDQIGEFFSNEFSVFGSHGIF